MVCKKYTLQRRLILWTNIPVVFLSQSSTSLNLQATLPIRILQGLFTKETWWNLVIGAPIAGETLTRKDTNASTINFCRRCLIFNPRDRKYKDLALTKHLCNYGITDMPKQKAKPVRKEEVIPEQVMDPQRIARLEAQQAQVTAMEAANQAAMVSASGNLYFALHPLTNMFLCRKGSSKRRNVNARRRRPKPGRGKQRRRRNPNLRKRERSKALIYMSAILAHIAYNMYVGLKNNYVLSKCKPKTIIFGVSQDEIDNSNFRRKP